MNSFGISIQKSESELILDSEPNFMSNDFWEQNFNGLRNLEDFTESNVFEYENNTFLIKTEYEDIFKVEEEEKDEYMIYENGESYFFEGANNILGEQMNKLEDDQSHYLIKTETAEQTEKTESVSQESFGIWSDLANTVPVEELYPTLLHRIKEEVSSENEDSNGQFLSGFENMEEMCDDLFYSINNGDYNNNNLQEIDGSIESKQRMNSSGESYGCEKSEDMTEEESSEQYSAEDELWTYQRSTRRKNRKSSRSNIKKRNSYLEGAASIQNRDSRKKYRRSVDNLTSEDCKGRTKRSSKHAALSGDSSSIVTRSRTAKRFKLGDIGNFGVERKHKPTPKRRISRKKDNKENLQEKPAPKRRVRYEGEHYSCNYCSYMCIVQASFERHTKEHKQNGFVPLKFSCTVCGEDENSKQEMKSHEASHKLGTYICCDICNFITLQMKKLIQHRRMHTGERPHRCPFCEYRSARRDNLRSHVRRKHSVTNLFSDTFSSVYNDNDGRKIKVLNNNNNYYN